MDTDLEILLTNDDGIDSPGFRALHDALSEVANVVAVAPADDQSAVGRTMSNEVSVEDHELGFAIGGTPVDCIVAGLEALGPAPDLVVSGCNTGANLGAYVLGRSGTVSAAVEAAFCGVPAIAVSLHIPEEEWPREPAVEEYAEACRATRHLVELAPVRGVFEHADYLNVNAPIAGEEPAPMRVTRPSTVYEMAATQDGDSITLRDLTWETLGAGEVDDPEGTDRRAIADGEVSVSPLTAPHTTEHHEALDRLADEY
ncbi:5'/3'-nucleotidase SurE [Halalkalicoccus tibetensis]|uniref:5'-nucleotidase SurE n=1 Tax=Halalkalicoccus tibetensis TaxID=175632 RepID=A0ABD5UZC2_9EURY